MNERKRDETGDALEHARRKLPREIPPRRDLWPAIARAIETDDARTVLPGAAHRERRAHRAGARTLAFLRPSWGLVFATAALAAIASSVLTSELTRGHRGGRAIVSATDRGPRGTARLLAEIETLDRECARIERGLLVRYESASRSTPDVARSALTENLAIVEAAITETRRAYVEHPQSPEIGVLALKAYRERLALLREAVRLENTLRRRDET